MIKKTLLAISVCLIMAGCASVKGKSDSYNTTNFPDSHIINVFEKNNINPASFAERLVTILKIEVIRGDVNPQSILAYTAWIRENVVYGAIKYSDINKIVNGVLTDLAKNNNIFISETILILKSIIDMDNIAFQSEKIITKEDTYIVLTFLEYIDSSFSQ